MPFNIEEETLVTKSPGMDGLVPNAILLAERGIGYFGGGFNLDNVLNTNWHLNGPDIEGRRLEWHYHSILSLLDDWLARGGRKVM